MGQHTILALSHDEIWAIEKDEDFGKNLAQAILGRGNPNIPQRACGVHGTQLGPQFHSRDTLLVSIEDGILTRLTVEEQTHLQQSLTQFRKKQEKEKMKG